LAARAPSCGAHPFVSITGQTTSLTNLVYNTAKESRRCLTRNQSKSAGTDRQTASHLRCRQSLTFCQKPSGAGLAPNTSCALPRRGVAEADACTERGQIGAMLRREGLYTSHLEKWRTQRKRGALQALTPQKRGPKVDPQATEIARLRRENERLQARLQQAETIIEVQKKLSTLLGPDAATTMKGDQS